MDLGVQPGGDLDADIDVAALQRKYEEERLKRLRADGIGQYRKLSALADFDTDPHADPDFTRAPVVEDVDVLIIGGGFGGLLAAGHLRQAGLESLRIVEKGADFGGTWYWTATRAPPAMSKLTSTCRCSKSLASCRPRNTPTAPRSSRIARRSPRVTVSTKARCSRRW